MPLKTSSRKWRIGLLVAVVAAISWMLFAVVLPRSPRYNVLLVTLDTTRADRLGCYGYEPALTPTFDELARNGVLFERAYATVPLTLPSHASLLTGLYPPENGIHINGRGPLPEQIPTLAEILQQAGYATGAFVGAVVLYGKTGLNQGFQVYDDDMAGGQRHGHETHLMRSGRLVVDSALAWLKRSRNQPFFCWVHLYDPHAPFEGHAEEFGTRFAHTPYDGDIAFADQQVGRLIKHLEQQKLADRTLVVVVGDHGEGFGEHDEQEHGFLLYNSTLRVPFLVSGPKFLRTGHRSQADVSQVDLLPTIVDVLQLQSPPHVSGKSFLPALRGESIAPRILYAETEACYDAYRWAPLAAVLDGRWKYIQSVRPELYDLDDDPGELKNLATSATEQMERMQQQFADVRGRMTAAPASDTKYDAEHLRQLKDLGYVSGTAATEPTDNEEQLPDVKDRLHYYNAEIEARKLLSSSPETAVEKLREVTAAAPDFTPAWLTLGAALQSLNRISEARDAYQSALETNPAAADAHFDLAKLHFAQGDGELAMTHYREALKINPFFAMAQINLAALLADRGAHDEARRHFEAGLEEFPDSTVGRYNFGMFLFRLADYEGAKDQLERAVALDPQRPEIRYLLGQVLAKLELPDAAAREFEQTLRLNPHHAGAASQLQRLQSEP